MMGVGEIAVVINTPTIQVHDKSFDAKLVSRSIMPHRMTVNKPRY